MSDDRKETVDPQNSAPPGIPGHETLDATRDIPLDETGSRLGAQASRVAGAAQSWIGRHIGRYEVRGLLGEGGMGVVYKGFDALIEREVAIKVLPEELADNEINLQRFLAEAKAVGKLSHPNVVAIYEVGKQGDDYYLVMEYVPGGTIADWLDQARLLSVAEATRIAADACRGLAAAHSVGLVHRDIKPANLLRSIDGSVKVADFGLAKPAVDATRQITQEGNVVGTPYFMSPEQCEARPVDQRSDVYSLGATYYTLLTGENPYDVEGSIVQVMYAHCQAEVPDPRNVNPALPAACAQIVARAMAKLPEARYQTATEMLADLEALLANLSSVEPIVLPSRSRSSGLSLPARMRRHALAGALAGTVVLLAAGLLAYSRGTRAGDDPPPARQSTATPLAAPAPTGPPIKVGVLHSLSGTMAGSETPVVEATLLAIEELNQSGGVLGRPVEPIVRDGRSDPSVFAVEAQRLLTEDQVCTVFGCWTSASRKTVVPLFEKQGNLLVYPVQYEGLEESPNVVYLGATPNQQIVPAIQWAFAFLGKRRFFVVGSDYVFPRAAGAIIGDTLQPLGAELVGEEYAPLGSHDFKAIVEKIIAARPDVILNLINGDSNRPFFAELRAAGATPERISSISFSIGEEELRHLNVAEMVGDYAAWSYFQSIDTAENRDFIARFRGQVRAQRVITDPMEAAYVGVKLWAMAVAQVKSDRVAEIRQALVHQRTLAPEGEMAIDPATQHTFRTTRIGQITADGQFEVIWKAVKPAAPLPFPPSRSRDEWLSLLDDLYRGWGDRWSAPAR